MFPSYLRVNHPSPNRYLVRGSTYPYGFSADCIALSTSRMRSTRLTARAALSLMSVRSRLGFLVFDPLFFFSSIAGLSSTLYIIGRRLSSLLFFLPFFFPRSCRRETFGGCYFSSTVLVQSPILIFFSLPSPVHKYACVLLLLPRRPSSATAGNPLSLIPETSPESRLVDSSRAHTWEKNRENHQNRPKRSFYILSLQGKQVFVYTFC